MNSIYIALGSNQGDRQQNLKAALSELAKLGNLTKVSSIYETEPKYELNQDKFLNMVCCLECSLHLTHLHKLTLETEKKLGRTLSYKNGPRVIDLDILYSFNESCDLPELKVPHPAIRERAFVLVPLNEIAPDLQIEKDSTVSNLLSRLNKSEISEVSFYSCYLAKKSVELNDKQLDYSDKTLLMGIINVTNDSFSGDGILHSGNFIENALIQARQMLDNGADILDIGGESSRPGSQQISEQQEIDRILPVIEKIKAEFNAAISVDTYKPKVADSALKAGAQIVNDIWAMKYDYNMADIVKKHNASIILMHNSSKTSETEQISAGSLSYKSGIDENLDPVQIIYEQLRNSAIMALQAGINKNNIIIDPGFGFGKSIRQNLLMLKNFSKFCELGLPLLSATSRKSFIGKILETEADNRLEGSLAAAVISVSNGANIIRTHDVLETSRALKIVDSALKA